MPIDPTETYLAHLEAELVEEPAFTRGDRLARIQLGRSDPSPAAYRLMVIVAGTGVVDRRGERP